MIRDRGSNGTDEEKGPGFKNTESKWKAIPEWPIGENMTFLFPKFGLQMQQPMPANAVPVDSVKRHYSPKCKWKRRHGQ